MRGLIDQDRSHYWNVFAEHGKAQSRGAKSRLGCQEFAFSGVGGRSPLGRGWSGLAESRILIADQGRIHCLSVNFSEISQHLWRKPLWLSSWQLCDCQIQIEKTNPSAMKQHPRSTFLSSAVVVPAAAVFTLFCCRAGADTLTVMNANDNGAGSLRQAILDANADDILDFDPSLSGSLIVLQSGELMINKDLTIDASGLSIPPLIDGNANGRVLQVAPGNDVLLDSLTIRNGDVPGSSGGGILNDGGTLTIRNSSIVENSAQYAGGIMNQGNGTVTLNDCAVSGNDAMIGGGGLWSQGPNDTVVLNRCTMSANTAGQDGGGILSSETLTITDSIISGNEAPGLFPFHTGGGIFQNSGGMLTITNSTFLGNEANEGGGLWNASPGTISGSNVIENSSSEGPGGGILNLGSLTIEDSTIRANESALEGGGLWVSGGTLTVN